MVKKGFFHHVSNIGKKTHGFFKRAFSIGKKATDTIDKVNSKVKQVTQIASTVANILPVPSSVRNVLSKVQNVSAKVDDGTKLVKKGIERGTELQQKAEKVGSVIGAARLGKETYNAGRQGLKTTRAFLSRPQGGDNVKSGKILDPRVSNSVRMSSRKKSDNAGRTR